MQRPAVPTWSAASSDIFSLFIEDSVQRFQKSQHNPQETRNLVIQRYGGPPMGVLHMPTAAGHHPLKSCPRHEATPHDNTEKRYIYTDY